MAVKLVNTFPGIGGAGPLRPGEPFHLGLKSETGSVSFGSLRVRTGLTSLIRGSSIPENDLLLKKRGGVVALETVERRQPVSGQITASITSDALRMQKSDNTVSNLSVYTLRTAIPSDASVMAYFKFKKAAWTTFAPDWVNLSAMVGPYFGLEYGPSNTGCFAFLRNLDNNGSLVVGGPLQTFSAARPGQQEFAGFDWSQLANGTVIELWIYVNRVGYPSPFSPASVPLIEVWTKRAGLDTVPVVHMQTALGSLGTFKTSGISNYRAAPSDTATLYFGLPGRIGDVLDLMDFALYPDFRTVVSQGVVYSGNRLFSAPDAPVMYDARDGALPSEIVPGRWQYLGIRPSASLRNRVGTQGSPLGMSITKTIASRSAYFKSEPRISSVAPVSSLDGAMVEGLLSAEATTLSGDLFGAGLLLDDGAKAYQVSLLDVGGVKTLGVLKVLASQASSVLGYYLPSTPIDWQTPRLVRLTIDRRRSKILVHVDEALVLDLPIAGTFPATEGESRVAFGHLTSLATAGRLDVTFVNYLPRYLAYEGSDGALPTASSVVFTSTVSDVGGASTMVNGQLVLKKASFNTASSKRLFSRADTFADSGGFLVDFKTQVTKFTNELGVNFSPSSTVGAGLTVFLGNKRVQLFFANCGIAGKVVAVLPGSGSVVDILAQTALGKKFSASVDWTQSLRYRIVCRAKKSLEVWVDNILSEPIISIPWRNDTDGFDLPTDPTAASISFGHFDQGASSTTVWDFVRWGCSNGYEVAVQNEHTELPSYLFGGQALITSEFDE